jgi:hypothetical protein
VPPHCWRQELKPGLESIFYRRREETTTPDSSWTWTESLSKTPSHVQSSHRCSAGTPASKGCSTTAPESPVSFSRPTPARGLRCRVRIPILPLVLNFLLAALAVVRCPLNRGHLELGGCRRPQSPPL